MAAVHAKQTITWTRGRLTWWTFITVDFEQGGGAFVADLERVLGLVVGRHVVDRQLVHRSAHGRIVLLVHLGNDLQLVLQPISHSVNRRIHPSIHQSIDRSVGQSVSQSVNQGYVRIRRHPQNWKYITYHYAVKAGPSHGHG